MAAVVAAPEQIPEQENRATRRSGARARSNGTARRPRSPSGSLPGMLLTSAPAPEQQQGDGLERIRQHLPALEGSLYRVGEYILTNPWEVRRQSITDVARCVGVSINTVNRFTREIGYRGYREFSQALALDLGKLLGTAYHGGDAALARPTPEGTGDVGVMFETLALELRALQDTIRQLDRDEAQRAVDALCAANAVLFIGSGAGLPLCMLAAYRLNFVGVRAVACGDPSAMMLEVHLLRRGDVVVAFSPYGRTPHLAKVLRHAHDRGITTMSLTSAPRSPVAQAAGIRLTEFSQQIVIGAGQVATRVAGAAVVEALIAAVVRRRFGGTPPHVGEVMRAQQELFGLLPPSRSERPGKS